MNGYEPTARRPIADLFRLTAAGATRLCVRAGIHPDTISYLSLGAAVLATLCLLRSATNPTLLLVAPLFCLLRLWCNMLDGMVALASGRASPRGEILNDLPDRISDVVIFAGAAHSGWMNPFLGYWAALLALLTAYIGILGQAVGVQREFSGVMSKPWRMVMLSLGAWLSYGLVRGSGDAQLVVRLTALDCACLVVVAGCLQTCAQRLTRILRALETRSRSR